MIEQLDDLAVAAASLLATGALQGVGDDGCDDKDLQLRVVATELARQLEQAPPELQQQLRALVEEAQRDLTLAAIVAKDRARINKAVYISEVHGDVSF